MRIPAGTLMGIAVNFADGTRLEDAREVVNTCTIETLFSTGEQVHPLVYPIARWQHDCGFGTRYLPMWRTIETDADITIRILNGDLTPATAPRPVDIQLEAWVSTSTGIKKITAEARVQ